MTRRTRGVTAWRHGAADNTLPRMDRLPSEVSHARLLNRRYLFCFAAAAALLLLNQYIVQAPLLRLAGDAPVINVAGRQRMLSQRLVKAALAMSAAETEAARSSRRDELENVLELWSASQEGLRRGDPARSLPGDHPPQVAAAFDEIEPSFLAMRSAATRMLATSDPAVAADEVAVLLRNEGEYLRRMDRIVSLYEAEARGRAERLRRTGWALATAALVALAAIGGFVLVPASKTIGRQVAALRDSRDRLEERVRERTAALEASHRALEEEHRERLAAEERHRRLLEQFGHAARVNTMGEMATALAHELNQPLGAIANYVGGCLERLGNGAVDPAGLREGLERAQAVTVRAGEIVRRVRRFATRHGFREEEVDPPRLVSEAVDLLRDDAARREIPVDIEVAPDLPSVRGDAVQLQQVLVNLIRNAFDAVDAARATAAAKPKRGNVIVSVGRSPDGAVSFSVIDDGDGIPPDRVARMFEPFHSTRAGGMGMGLAISRSIVEAHRGEIRVESVPGERTCVGFTLPTDRP